MEPGIYTIPYEQYEAAEGVSKHGLDAMAISPLHHWAYYRNPERGRQKDTPARVLGSAIHTSILEPERFDLEYVQEPNIKDYPQALDKLDDYKKACKELEIKVTGTKPELKKSIQLITKDIQFWDDIYEQQTFGRIVLSDSDWRVTKTITARVMKHPAASGLLKYGKAEQSIFWIDKDTGVKCKGRIDWLETDEDTAIVFDLKSTTDASPEGFQRSVSKYRYYVQASMYLDGLSQLGYDPGSFIFGAWEKHSPYAAALYYATDGMLETGRQEYKNLLKTYKKCLETDNWPGYSQDIQPLGMPEHFKPSSLSELEPESDWLDEMSI